MLRVKNPVLFVGDRLHLLPVAFSVDVTMTPDNTSYLARISRGNTRGLSTNLYNVSLGDFLDVCHIIILVVYMINNHSVSLNTNTPNKE